jgi:hypothetical protein
MSGPAIFSDPMLGGPAGSVGGGGGAATSWPTTVVQGDALLTSSQGVIRIDTSLIAPGGTLTITIPQAILVKGTGEQQYLLKSKPTNDPSVIVLIQRDPLGTNVFEGLGPNVTSFTMAPGDSFWLSGVSASNLWMIS